MCAYIKSEYKKSGVSAMDVLGTRKVRPNKKPAYPHSGKKKRDKFG